MPTVINGRVMNGDNKKPSRTLMNSSRVPGTKNNKYDHKVKSSNSFRSKDHKVLIIGDSHIRLCAVNVKSEVKGLVKPGAGSGTLVNSANSDITNLTKSDFVIFCGGAKDVAKRL